jgi:hypothetical protein
MNTPEEKIALLRLHVWEQVPVAEICEQFDIAAEDFDLWLEEISEAGVFPVDEEAQFPLRIKGGRLILRPTCGNGVD